MCIRDSYKSLYRFRSLVIAAAIDCFGIYLEVTGQLDMTGRILCFLMGLAFSIRAFLDFRFTDNYEEARRDRELSTKELLFFVILLSSGTIAFLWYALTR